jgi:predicted PhzF superfamily epimerase YddE/YHI9
MIMPGAGEDHVCGSAHCLLGPYWYTQKGLPLGEKVISTIVSARGGNANLIWEQDNTLRLQGEAVIFATGEVFV